VEVRQYRTVEGRTPIAEWLDGLRDLGGRGRIVAHLDRLSVGLKGDWRSVGNGVYELRIDAGPGYRVYYAQDGNAVILLLCGGDKRTQVRDIGRAYAYWEDYKTRA
jgi:putative addiction module killer protein